MMMFRNPQLLWLLLTLPAFVLFWRWHGVRVPVAALVLRLLTVTLLILALADPLIATTLPPEGALVVLVDQSDSLAETTRAALRAQATELARSADAKVLYVGANVASAGEQEDAAVDPGGSDLAAGLRAARALLPGGGQVILVSDGLATSPDTLAEARLAAQAGISVDVAPVAPAETPEVAITGLKVPRTLRLGEAYPIEISVRSTGAPGPGGPVSGRLRLWEGEVLLGDEQVLLTPGEEVFSFSHTAGAVGIVRLRAELEAPAGDTFSANNRAAAVAEVNPPPQVLLVAAGDDEAALLGDALRRQGVETRRVRPAELPSRLVDLAVYDGVVLVDVPAAALSLDQMASVRELVRSEGRGLVAIGGRNSFTLGAYKDTPLEETLPVTMEPPPRPQRTEIALLLIVDRSASMTAAVGVSKFDMAKEAAILATESLKPEDRIGVLAFDTGQLWVVPFQQVGEGASLAAIQQAILELPSGGGTDIEMALAEGLPALARQPTSVRHAVLLTDGRSFTNNMANYERLVQTARDQQITLSTIAIGEDADTALLDQLARWGAGRYYFAARPEDIPRLTLLESEIARSAPVVEGPVQPALDRPHPIVRDFAPAELPDLAGYVATTARPAADVVLRAPDDDPLLAAWQYGLGRAVAWTPTAGEPWAAAWTRWEGFERFWAQTVRYTLPEPDSGPLQVRVETRPGGGARLVVDALQPGGAPLDLATVNARVTLPGGEQRAFDVPQMAPGRYAQDLVLTTPGAYLISVVLLHEGRLQQREVGFVQPVAPEYRQHGDPAEGRALLEALATATGGRVLADLEQAGLPETGALEAPEGLWPWLLGLALGLWVLEIAVRRGVFVRA
ncbi:MAG: VWA domain-containing protein [Chloroflexaceae bacterium]